MHRCEIVRHLTFKETTEQVLKVDISIYSPNSAEDIFTLHPCQCLFSLSDDSHSDTYEVTFHCDFDLYLHLILV